MSSPTSSLGSSCHSPLDDSQSTKDRRRERNRLAAQKHRLRRTQRMSQLEQQVLALQQEKHSLLSQLDPRDAADWCHADGPQRKRARPDPAPRVSLVTVDDADDVEKDYVSRLEDRIIELERWTEDLNGSLHDALDSEKRLTSELHAHELHADAQSKLFRDTMQSHAVEKDALQREIRMLNRRADSVVKTEVNDETRLQADKALESDLQVQKVAVRDLRAENARLSEMLESCEVTLELQRRENGALRDRLHVLTSSTQLESEENAQTVKKLQAAEEELEHLKDDFHEQRLTWNHTLEQERQRLTDSLDSGARSTRQLEATKSKVTELEVDNGRLKEMIESFESKIESLEDVARAKNDDERRLKCENEILKGQLCAVDGAGKDKGDTDRRVWEERARAADEEIRDVQRRLQQQDAAAKAQERVLHEKLDATEQERQRLDERVSSLTSAWEKVSAFLASKGIPIDLD